jgi:hypothetical protein
MAAPDRVPGRPLPVAPRLHERLPSNCSAYCLPAVPGGRHPVRPATHREPARRARSHRCLRWIEPPVTHRPRGVASAGHPCPGTPCSGPVSSGPDHCACPRGRSHRSLRKRTVAAVSCSYFAVDQISMSSRLGPDRVRPYAVSPGQQSNKRPPRCKGEFRARPAFPY